MAAVSLRAFPFALLVDGGTTTPPGIFRESCCIPTVRTAWKRAAVEAAGGVAARGLPALVRTLMWKSRRRTPFSMYMYLLLRATALCHNNGLY